MSDRENLKFNRRDFLKTSLVLGGLAVATGVGYREVHNSRGRDYDVVRTERFLANIPVSEKPGELPNVILILTDDLGYGDLSGSGSGAIHTPNLDSLAGEGVQLTNFYATAALCSPSRAGLLTGRYPIRTHITMPLYPEGAVMDIIFNISGGYRYGVRGIPQDEVLLSEILQRRGYRTALVGKWHLGDRSPHLPNERGFDLFYGAYYSNDVTPYAIYRNTEIELDAPADQNTLTQNFTQEALDFISADSSRPFFLYYAQPFPHRPLHASEEFRGTSEAGLYGDTVQEIDWSVGEILRKVDEKGLRENTLVIFSSDNGPWWQGNPGELRGRKSVAFEGGFRVPFIARWPGVIPGGTVSDEMSMNFDIFPTVLSAAGLSPPDDRVIDGVDILPMLKGETRSPHETLYFYRWVKLTAVRHRNWKYHRRHMTDNGGYATLSQGPFLFDLGVDPNESYSQIESHPQVADDLKRMLDEWEAQMDANPRGWINS